MGVGGQRHAPAALPPGNIQYPLYRRLGGPQGRSGRVRKISPPPGFDPRTVQPIASRYTDWAIQAASVFIIMKDILSVCCEQWPDEQQEIDIYWTGNVYCECVILGGSTILHS